ncbi:MAG: hypothetical protein ACO3FE_21920, partial [Planctomycetaceae bacterium]
MGGKWTSFRAFSEHAANHVLERIEASRTLSTKNLPIGGSKGYPKTPAERDSFLNKLIETADIEQEHLTQLFETYGSKTATIIDRYPVEA